MRHETVIRYMSNYCKRYWNGARVKWVGRWDAAR